jgi:hypothetical protein
MWLSDGPTIWQITETGQLVDCGPADQDLSGWHADFEGKHHYFVASVYLEATDV